MRLEERINQDVLKFSEAEMSVSKSSSYSCINWRHGRCMT
jgi:hypothetical protein